MKTAYVLLALLGTALGGVLEPRGHACNANDCARAVTGYRFPTPVVSSHRADCTSFMQITIDSDGDCPNVTPTAVPAYATACSGAAKYSSACSCWGIGVTYVTMDIGT